MEFVILTCYCIALFFIFLFSIGQLHLTWHYRRAWRKANQNSDTASAAAETEPTDWPKVCVQLPIFNEKYVVERLIDCMAVLDYPADKLEIQVLDDSSDETVEITAARVEEWKSKGVNIAHVRRPERKGFKAGALEYGMHLSDAEYIAIFDADFLPEPGFLKKTIPHFVDEGIGVVQTRWGHINRDYSMLTRLQAFGLDAHFTIEQTGRSNAGSFINFNGTAGVWRKQTILDAGGWSADTLTEDLDLSYRAQLKGWKFRFLEDVISPAELPVIMPAIKSQQYRWNKGAAETARKNLGKVLKSEIGFGNKVHAILHLLNSSVFLALLFAALLSIPMLFVKYYHPELQWVFNLGSIFLFGFFSIGYFYWVSSRKTMPGFSLGRYIRTFPTFLTMSMGLSLHNALAVSEGLLGFKSPFIRTPKFNITNSKDSWKGNVYIRPQISIMTLLEGLLALYFIAGLVAGFMLGDYGLMFFHVMLALGFLVVFYHSVKPVRHG